MDIVIRAVGRLRKSDGFRQMSEFYCTRVGHFAGIRIHEVKEQSSIRKERQLLLRKTGKRSYRVALRETGSRMNTAQFARFMNERRITAIPVEFYIGGAYGLGDIGESTALSIAPWTLPHQLARIVLLEQIYRALSVINGKKYHHS